MSYPPELEKKIQHFAAVRTERIGELKMLWARLCRLKNEEVSTARLNDLINKKFETRDGLGSLDFESIEIVKSGLLESIAKAEKSDEKTKTIAQKTASGN